MTDGQKQSSGPEKLSEPKKASGSHQTHQDPLVSLYREAVAQDVGPGTQVREMLFAYAKSKAKDSSEGVSTEGQAGADFNGDKSRRAQTENQSAANDSYWRRHAFASVAAVAVVGWLFMHQLPVEEAKPPRSASVESTSAPAPAAASTAESAADAAQDSVAAAPVATRPATREREIAANSRLDRSLPGHGDAKVAGELVSPSNAPAALASREEREIGSSMAKPQAGSREAKQAKRVLPYCDELAQQKDDTVSLPAQAPSSVAITADAEGVPDDEVRPKDGRKASESTEAMHQQCRQRDKPSKSKTESQSR